MKQQQRGAGAAQVGAGTLPFPAFALEQQQDTNEYGLTSIQNCLMENPVEKGIVASKENPLKMMN